MVLTDNNLPSYGKSNMQPLFAPSGAKPAAPGDFGVTGSGVIAPNPQVFSTEWENVEWKNFTDPQTRGTHLVEYAELTTNTVANPAFGTQGGQLVSLLLFFVLSDEPVLFGTVPGYVDTALSTS